MVATVIAGERALSGDAVEERALRAVSALDRIGIGAGAVVALMLRNDLAALEAMLALRRAGSYAVPVNWHFKADESGYVLRDSGAQALIIHTDLLPQIESAIPETIAIIAVEPGAPLRSAFALTPEHAARRGPAGIGELHRRGAALCRAAAAGGAAHALFLGNHRPAQRQSAARRWRRSKSRRAP